MFLKRHNRSNTRAMLLGSANYWPYTINLRPRTQKSTTKPLDSPTLRILPRASRPELCQTSLLPSQ